MKYPKRLIRKGEKDKTIVKAIQKRLNELLCGPLKVDGDYGNKTRASVKLFQSRHTDSNNIPLLVDGIIGSISWEIMFNKNNVGYNDTNSNALLKKTVEIAISQIGVVENPMFSNRGAEVDEYIRRSGLDPENHNYAWCMSFVYWCFDEASNNLTKENPLVKTAGVLNQWNKTIKYKKIRKVDAINNPEMIKPGFVFIKDYGGGLGHTGIVEKIEGGYVHTIEGNTNLNHSRNGYGVFRLKRKITEIQRGFIDFGTKI